jgi:hypothetical protein
VTKKCVICGKSFQGIRPQAMYCGATCRKRAQRGTIVPRQPVTRQKIAPPVPEDGGELEANTNTNPNSLVIATRKELEAAGCAESMMGQQALRIAQQMSGFETAGGMAALSKELSRVMAEAVRTAPPLVADPVDELARRREEKLAAG